MKLNAYTIYDVASGVYMRPFFSQADGQAVRGFKDIATDADHEVGKHPEDYTLYRIGTFNDTTGKMEGEQLEMLMTALQCVTASRQINKDQMDLLDNEIGAQNGQN
uniref:phage ORF5 protein n=1 Tax=Shewanella sp. TaxID=50422 RepID=UPI00404809B6